MFGKENPVGRMATMWGRSYLIAGVMDTHVRYRGFIASMDVAAHS
jgi:hypothetical protein